MRIDRLLSQSAKQIEQSKSSDSAKLDAEILLATTLDKPRSYLYAYPENQLTPSQIATYKLAVTRRINGEPIAYIVGKKEFWSLEFEVDENVLIPRPDTECLVESILALPLNDNADIVDLGTGSGAIALALAYERPSWSVLAVDLQAGALKLAHKNCRQLIEMGRANNTLFLQASWMSALAEQSFDLVVSNPPYIDGDDHHLKQGDVRFEPRSALVSENHGLADIQILAEQAVQCLKPGGYLVVEHGYQQAEAVCEILAALNYKNIASQLDYANKARFVAANIAL